MYTHVYISHLILTCFISIVQSREKQETVSEKKRLARIYSLEH